MSENITIISPANQREFAKSDAVLFKWEAPVPFPDGESVFYHMKIVKINENQTPEEAIEQNPVWYEKVTNPSTATYGYSFQLQIPLDILSNYAWQVIGFVKQNETDVEVGRSSIYTFKGPPLLEEFYAGLHIVKVTSTSNTDLTDLSGTAQIQWGKAEPLNVQFEHLYIKDLTGGRMVLNSGEIIHSFEMQESIPINPYKTENGEASFIYDKLRLNKDALSLQGNLSWNLPHAATSSNKVHTMQTWLNYDKFKVRGAVTLAENNVFDLAEPQGFSLELDNRSYFLINDNVFFLRFAGKILLPESIRTLESLRVAVPFPGVDQLAFFPNLILSGGNEIRLVNNTGLVLEPRQVTIDLSDNESPGKQAIMTAWKGVYFEEYDILLHQQVDPSGNKIRIAEEIRHSVITDLNDGQRHWADNLGMHFTYGQTWETNNRATVGAYSSTLTRLSLNIEAGTVAESYLQGKTFIPAYNGQDSLNYKITINQDGLGEIHLFENDGVMVLLEEPYLSAPQEVSYKNFSFSWFAVKEAVHYIVDISNDNFDTMLDGYSNLTVNDTTLTVSGLSANTDYQIRVKAVYANGEFTTSLPITQKTGMLPSVPNVPLHLIASFDGNTKGMTLQWQDESDNEEGFIIEKSIGNQEMFTEIAITGPDITSYLDENTEAGTYHYRIQAFNDGGKSAYSETSGTITSIRQDLVSHIEVFPNPARETITVRSSKKVEKAVMYDMAGRKQLEFFQGFDKMEVSALQAGMYAFHLHLAGQDVQIVKVLIK